MHPVFPGCGVIKKGPGGVSCPVLDRYAITDYVTKMDAMLPRMMEAAGVTEELKPATLCSGGADEYAESTGGGNYRK